MIVHAAPGGDAVEIAHVIHLWQCEKLLPGEHKWVLARAADLEPPIGRGDGWHVAEIEHGPIRDLPLANRQLRHAVTIRRSRSRRGEPLESHVHSFAMQLALAPDVAKPLLDEVVHNHSLSSGCLLISPHALRARRAERNCRRPRALARERPDRHVWPLDDVRCAAGRGVGVAAALHGGAARRRVHGDRSAVGERHVRERDARRLDRPGARRSAADRVDDLRARLRGG